MTEDRGGGACGVAGVGRGAVSDKPTEPSIHIAAAEKREGLPDVGDAKKCGRRDCPAPQFEMGFGLAGGGYGPYEFCDTCGLIVSKTAMGPDDA